MQTEPLQLPTIVKTKTTQKSAAFPSASYFQQHFEYLYELINNLKNQLDLANEKINQLQHQLNKHGDHH